MDQLADGACAQRQHAGDLGVAAPLELPLDDRIALTRGQLPHCRYERGQVLLLVEHVLGSIDAVHLLDQGLMLVLAVVAQAVEGAVSDHPQEPGPGLDPRVGRQRVAPALERLLNDVLGPVGPAIAPA